MQDYHTIRAGKLPTVETASGQKSLSFQLIESEGKKETAILIDMVPNPGKDEIEVFVWRGTEVVVNGAVLTRNFLEKLQTAIGQLLK